MHSYRSGTDFVKFNPQCQIGYYDQEMAELDPKHNLLDTLRAHCQRTEQDYSAGLIQAGFPHKDFDKSVAVLSGGEKARLMFLLIKLNQPNFLIMDEPTNHIDIQGKEELEAQLLQSQATLLVTSHDRRFVDQIAQRYLIIADGKLREINDPNEFYAKFQHAISQAPDSGQTAATMAAPATATPYDGGSAVSSEDELDNASDEARLERLIDLEALLEADLARKPRFQKPRLQSQWREEIARLGLSLG
jgi:ABC-type multidrug transport system ATPase subunit